MEKKNLDLSVAYQLLNPGLVVIVSAGDGDRDNLFSVTWNMPTRKEPAMVSILSGKRHFTYPLIAGEGEFGINIPDASLVDQVLGCGSVSGKTVDDKFNEFNLTRQKPEKIKAPLVEEAIATIECRVSQIVDLGASSLIIAQILAAKASPVHYGKEGWNFDNGLKLLHHLGGKRFTTSEKVLNAKPYIKSHI